MDKKNRNKQLLFQALIDLMKVKPVNRISVSELTERAGVNRTSFYNFYTSIDDMIQKIETDLSLSLGEALKEYGSQGNPHETATKLFTFLFHFVQDNSAIFGFLLSPESNYIVIKKTTDLILEYLASEAPEQHFALPFITFGFIGVIQQWLFGGMKETPEQMAVLSVSFIEKGTGHLKSVLAGSSVDLQKS